MDWSLLDCGRKGHLTYAPSEAGVRRQLLAQAESGEAWRCLRCGAYIAGGPLMSGPAAEAPVPRRGKEVRSALILRVFAVERFLRALAVAAISFVVWRFEYARESIEQAFDRERPELRNLFHQLGYNIDNSKLVGLFNRALTLSPTTIKLLAIGLVCYAAIEVVEGVGLWIGRRWGEYFAMVATSVGLPFEIYDLVNKVSAIGFVLFAINLFLVLYLVITKRLFGVRGGKRAYDARLRSESIMDAAIAAAAAPSHPTEPAQPEAPTPNGPPAGAMPQARTSAAQPGAHTPDEQQDARTSAAQPGAHTPDEQQDARTSAAQPGAHTPDEQQDARTSAPRRGAHTPDEQQDARTSAPRPSGHIPDGEPAAPSDAPAGTDSARAAP